MKPAVIDPPEIWARLWAGFEGHTGWDIGANCGQTVPIMLDNFEQVIAFEPAKECWPYLAEFAGNFTYLPIGLSDRDDHIDLVALPDKIDTGQLVTAGTNGMEWNPDRPDASVRTVVCRSIDSLLNEAALPVPDFMKIDTEGHELRVLFGARQTSPCTALTCSSNSTHPSCTTAARRSSNSTDTNARRSDTRTTAPELRCGCNTVG